MKIMEHSQVSSKPETNMKGNTTMTLQFTNTCLMGLCLFMSSNAMAQEVAPPATQTATPVIETTVTTKQATIQYIESQPAKKAQEKIYFPITGGLEAGGIFPRIVSNLDTSFIVGIELGYLLPTQGQQWQIFSDLHYIKPGHENSLLDGRVTSGEKIKADITVAELLWSLGALYRFLPLGTQLNYYAQLGVRAHFQKSELEASTGTVDLDTYEETKTKVGGMLAGGVEYMMGPGALSAELDFFVADLNHQLTGNSSSGGLTLQLGYHFFF